MGSPRTCGSRGGVIVPLRPDVMVDNEANRRRTSPRHSAATAAQERRDGPEQLTLFDERPDR